MLADKLAVFIEEVPHRTSSIIEKGNIVKLECPPKSCFFMVERRGLQRYQWHLICDGHNYKTAYAPEQSGMVIDSPLQVYAKNFSYIEAIGYYPLIVLFPYTGFIVVHRDIAIRVA